MKICKNCNSKNIKTRKNYSHGKNSACVVSLTCRDCGSWNVGEEQKKFRRRK